MDSEQGYNQANFERSNFNGAREETNMKGFSTEEISKLFPLKVRESTEKWYIHDLLVILKNPAKIQLNQLRT